MSQIPTDFQKFLKNSNFKGHKIMKIQNFIKKLS